jgi:ADP-heptose:LPS heptosyltransferase
VLAPRSLKKWHYALILRFRYLSRIVRAELLRILLRICLPFFALKKSLRPPENGYQKKILIIVIGGMGDCLLFDPLFRRLKDKWPKSRIDVMTGCFEDMWQNVGSVDRLIFFTPTKFKPPWAYVSLFHAIYQGSYDIVAEGIAMVPQRGIYPVFTSLVFEASRAPIRIGRKTTGQYARVRPQRPGFIGREEMTELCRPNKNTHKNRYLTHIIEPMPPNKRPYHESAVVFESLKIPFYRKKDEPRLQPNPPLDKWAAKLLRQQWATKDDIIVGLTVETTHPIKSWPIENFLSILRSGIDHNFKFVMLGLAPQSSSSPFREIPNSELLDLTAKTTLGEMIAIIRQCDVFLSCDTGPSHIAQACRIPTIVLFGPTNEKEFGPFDSAIHTLILPPGNPNCRPCTLGPCIKDQSCVCTIRPEVVYSELIQKVRNLPAQKEHPVPSEIKRPCTLCII